MNAITKDITLGFYDDVGTYTVYAKQGDTNRQLHITFADEMKAYVLQDLTYIFVTEVFSNGTLLTPVLLADASYSPDRTEVTIPITQSMLAVAGLAKCELAIVKSDVLPEFDTATGQFKFGPDIYSSVDGAVYEAIDGTTPYTVPTHYQVLTTANFNIYIESNVAQTGSLNMNQQALLNELLPLVISAHEVVDHDIEYSDNEQRRIENENTRQNNEVTRLQSETRRNNAEAERQRVEQKRVAFEGRGDYTTHEDIEYMDDDNTEKVMPYQNSRTGVNERIQAIVEGGHYIDKDGQEQEVKNTYIDRDGNEVDADTSAYAGMSYKAFAEYIKNVSIAEVNDDIALAETYAEQSAENATLAESFAKGGTGERVGEDTDNAMYYKDQAQSIANNLSGTLNPMGPIAFENLPASPVVGWMYQMTDDYTTDSRFIEGAGVQGYEGDMVYYTNQDKWSILLGSTVRGVKGAKETSYRQGQVVLTPENIGAIPDIADSSTMYGQTVIYDGTGWAIGNAVPEGLDDGGYEFKALHVGTGNDIAYLGGEENYNLTNGDEVDATGFAVHGEGHHTWAQGNYSHSEGESTISKGVGSHSEGIGTIANQDYQHVAGKYNNNKTDTLYEVGNGTSGSNRSNALEVTQDGYIMTGKKPSNGSVTRIAFGVDSNGNYGYIKPGADSVVPFKNPQGTKTITSNGSFNIEDFSSVNVSVPNPSSGTLSISSNGVFNTTPYANVNVAVPQPSPSGTINLGSFGNGTFTRNVAWYSDVTFNVNVGYSMTFPAASGYQTININNYIPTKYLLVYGASPDRSKVYVSACIRAYPITLFNGVIATSRANYMINWFSSGNGCSFNFRWDSTKVYENTFYVYAL